MALACCTLQTQAPLFAAKPLGVQHPGRFTPSQVHLQGGGMAQVADPPSHS